MPRKDLLAGGAHRMTLAEPINVSVEKFDKAVGRKRTRRRFTGIAVVDKDGKVMWSKK